MVTDMEARTKASWWTLGSESWRADGLLRLRPVDKDFYEQTHFIFKFFNHNLSQFALLNIMQTCQPLKYYLTMFVGGNVNSATLFAFHFTVLFELNDLLL